MRIRQLCTLALWLMVLSFFTSIVCDAQTDSEVKYARHKAASFLNVAENRLSKVNLTTFPPLRSVCVFNDSANHSFVITSINGNMPEILGYSDNGLFDDNNVPPQLRDLLEEYEAISPYAIQSAESHSTLSIKDMQMAATEKKLNTALYDQQSPYNNYCPSGCYTGCTATAMSIAMRYYKWPTYGRGQHSYEWNGKTLNQNFNTKFDWSDMLTAYTKGKYNTTQGNAVAKLCYACGVSVNMDYSTTGSTASVDNAATSLIKYFKYSPQVIYIRQEQIGYTSTEWMNLIKKEINEGRPIIHEGKKHGASGHAFIIQGYKDNYVNVNWGWGGRYNGYFLLSSMIPTEGRDYSYNHGMIVNITPDYSESEFSPLQIARVVSTQSLISDVDAVRKNIKFIVTTGSLQNRDNETFDGQIAIALINKKCEIRDIVYNGTMTLKSGYYYETLPISCKSKVYSDDGDSLALMWRYADDEDWKRVPGDGVVKTAIAVRGVSEEEKAAYSPLQSQKVNSEKDMTVSTEMIKKNKTFYVTTGNLQNIEDETYEDSVAIALINKERKIREIVGCKKITLESGYYFSSLSFTCKSSINSEDGDSIALMWKFSTDKNWKFVHGDGVVKSVVAVKGVNETEDGIPYSMLTSVWGQQEVFCSSCPNNYKPGCAAVAVSQIMNYYRTTNSGYGTNIYKYLLNKTDTTEVSIDYSQHTFDWANIIGRYNGNASTTAVQKSAVCDLLYTTGTALFMQYRDGGSAPKNEGSMLWGLHHYLHFSPASIHRYRRFYSTAEWIEMLDAQLTKHQPVFYGGSYCNFINDSTTSRRIGHYWVIDGKNDDGLYHANFGTGNSLNLKYTTLDLMQQTVADNVYPGGFAVCYGHNDMMITDIVPQVNVTVSDYAIHNLILTRPIYYTSDHTANKKCFNLTESFALGFDFSNYDRNGGTTYYKIGLYQNGQLKGFANAHNKQGYYSITLNAGYYKHLENSFVLPSNLATGIYEMHFVTQNRETGEWQQVLESVKGEMKLNYSNGRATITLPTNHTLPTGLYLKEEVAEIKDEYNETQAKSKEEEGVSLRLSLINPSNNNFCDTLRLEFRLATGETKVLSYTASVYDNSELEYHIFVPSQLVDLSRAYSLNLSYYDSTSKAFIPLTRISGIESVNKWNSSSTDLYVYQMNGVLVTRIPRQRVNTDYSAVLSSLAHGIYIIKDGNETRKVIK